MASSEVHSPHRATDATSEGVPHHGRLPVAEAAPSVTNSLQPAAEIQTHDQPMVPLRDWEAYLNKFMPDGDHSTIPNFVIPATPERQAPFASAGLATPHAKIEVAEPSVKSVGESDLASAAISSVSIAADLTRFKEEFRTTFNVTVETAQTHLETCVKTQRDAFSIVDRAFEWFEKVRMSAELDRAAIDGVRRDWDEKATTLRDLDSRFVKLSQEQRAKDTEIQRLHKQYEFVQDHLNAALREQRAVEKRMAEAHEQRETALADKVTAMRESEEMRATARRAISQRDEAISIRKAAEAAITDAHLHISELRTSLAAQTNITVDLKAEIVQLKLEKEARASQDAVQSTSSAEPVVLQPVIDVSAPQGLLPPESQPVKELSEADMMAQYVNTFEETSKEHPAQSIPLSEGPFSDEARREISHQLSDADLDALFQITNKQASKQAPSEPFDPMQSVEQEVTAVDVIESDAAKDRDRSAREPSFPGAFM